MFRTVVCDNGKVILAVSKSLTAFFEALYIVQTHYIISHVL